MLDVDERVAMTLSCRDCDQISKVPGAGEIVSFRGETVQLMHNGVRVVAGGYHGAWMSEIIRGLRGHHEPQEELVFHELVSRARPGTLMVELASFWAYYTLWYLQRVAGSTAICVEPDPENMAIGKRNAGLNDCCKRIRFVEAWIGASAASEHEAVCETLMSPRKLPCLDMGALLRLCGGRDIELLHIDAQGAELGFLRSMGDAIRQGQLRFLVVSTHHAMISGSSATHLDCIAEIERQGGHILAAHSVGESFSGDGLIAASFLPDDRSIQVPAISRNRPEHSLFGSN